MTTAAEQPACDSAGSATSDTTGQDVPPIDPKIFALLVCPVTKTSLEYDGANQELISHAAHLAFPIRNGIPIMLIDEARQLAED